MTLNTTGQISLGGSTAGQSIASELALTTTSTISLNDDAVKSMTMSPLNLSSTGSSLVLSTGSYNNLNGTISPVINFTMAYSSGGANVHSIGQRISVSSGTRYLEGVITSAGSSTQLSFDADYGSCGVNVISGNMGGPWAVAPAPISMPRAFWGKYLYYGTGYTYTYSSLTYSNSITIDPYGVISVSSYDNSSAPYFGIQKFSKNGKFATSSTIYSQAKFTQSSPHKISTYRLKYYNSSLYHIGNGILISDSPPQINRLYISKILNNGLSMIWSVNVRSGLLSRSVWGNDIKIATYSTYELLYVVGYYNPQDGTYKNYYLLLDGSNGTSYLNSTMSTGKAYSGLSGVTSDNSGNVYLVGYIANGDYDYSFQIYKCTHTTALNSTPSISWQKSLTSTNWGSYNGYANKVVLNSNSTMLYVICNAYDDYTNDYCYLLKYNTSGTLQWQRVVIDDNWNLIYDDLVIDSNENIYILGYNYLAINSYVQKVLTLFKYNSSGTLQWARKIYNASATPGANPINFYGESIAIDPTDNTICIAVDMQNNGATTSAHSIIRLPNNGGKTGTFTINGYTLTYDAYGTMLEVAGNLVETTTSHTFDGVGPSVSAPEAITHAKTSTSYSATVVPL